MTPLQRYQSDLDAGLVTADSAQLEVLNQLQDFFEAFTREQARPNGFLSRFWQRTVWRKLKPPPVIKGNYLWGSVGRGKTYLMDILYDCLPPDVRLRTHFHRFMQGVHAELHNLQGRVNPLQHVADKLAKKYKVVCFDEFFVIDIGDAMILTGLLDAMFQRGVVLVTTSNMDPDGLYENGLQRSRFLPAIALLKQNMHVIQIAAGADYRLRTLSKAVLYYYPNSAETDAKLVTCFKQLAPDHATIRENCEIEILNRKIVSRLCANDVVWFEFSQLCDGPRSAYDYVEIAKLFHALFLSEVPQLTDQNKDQVRRFINLVDELYDRRVKLIIAAEVDLAELYLGRQLAFEFERARSRLIEMQSYAYLGYGHRA